MRHGTYIIPVVLCAALSAASCATETVTHSDGYGSIVISVTGGDDALGPVELTLSTADDAYSHTWADAADFPVHERFVIGGYSAKAVQGVEGSEGYGCPCYMARSEFSVSDGSTSRVQLDLTLSQAAYSVYCTDLSGSYNLSAVHLHTPGKGYVEVDVATTAPLYIQPGPTTVYVTVADSEGCEATLSLTDALVAEPGDMRSLYISIDTDDSISLSCGDIVETITLSHDIFTEDMPQIECVGFSSDDRLVITEGYPHREKVMMRVEAPAGLSALTLTAITESPLPDDLPTEVDILTMAGDLERYGLHLSIDSEGSATLDFSDMLENISVNHDTDIAFMLVARDRLGRVSAPATLDVEIRQVSLQLESLSEAVIGIDRAQIVMTVNVPDVEISDFEVLIGNDVAAAPHTGEFDSAQRRVTLDFSVPEGTEELPLSIHYLGRERLQAQVRRTVPEYSLSADAFATFAIIRVNTPFDQCSRAIAKYIELASGAPGLRIYSRNPDDCTFVVSVLSPDKAYEIPCQVVSPKFHATVRLTTESALSVPDGDFEDAAPLFEYDRLPSGGKYSASAFPIYNMQNYTDIDVWWPKKHWASLNAKTFCTAAANHNTWYMQPSTTVDFGQSVSGSKSMRISTVGWSIDGAEIEPSVQTGSDYIPYNTNIPPMDHVTAGRLFLGSYSFDAQSLTERYIPGVPFTSRPSSLNGFYKYIPDASCLTDHGVVEVELVNDSGDAETVVAFGRLTLGSAPDFKSFNLPLQFLCYNVKPTRLKMMFCSSDQTDGLGFDDTRVPVSAHPESATFSGSVLWIDNLSFSY